MEGWTEVMGWEEPLRGSEKRDCVELLYWILYKGSSQSLPFSSTPTSLSSSSPSLATSLRLDSSWTHILWIRVGLYMDPIRPE